MLIRDARPGEGGRLREIAIAAKEHWGYERAWVEEWAADGDFSAEGLHAKRAFVADEDGRVVGWGGVLRRGETAWLDDLWVEPEAMERGVGTELFAHARELARSLGASRLEWEAEPNSVGFYEKMGARRLREGVMGVEL